MKFKVLACDFDGTLASEGQIEPSALEAIEKARQAGLRVILVTGRTFFELTRVCERLDLFDAVVAENGAVLYFPRNAMIRDQGPAPPTRLLNELDQRGISCQVGRAIVGTSRADERGVREALEAAGVNRELVYNRAALMLLPVGIEKGQGVEHVLRSFGLSFQDALALEDAENDLALFEACAWAACPGNAIPELKARADWVFSGENGESVAVAITGSIIEGRLPARHSPRLRIAVGWVVETSEPATIPARDVNVLIYGDPLSGKSWLAGALVERLKRGAYATCVIDPEGDYHVLARLPGVTGVAIQTEGGLEAALQEFEHDPASCLVADLSSLEHARKLRIIARGLARIRELRARLGRPHWVVLDEAQYSLHREGVPEHAVGIEDKGFCLPTYRPSWIRDSVIKAVDVFLLGRTTARDELAFLRSALAALTLDGDRAVAVLPDLPPGKFVLVQGGEGAGALTFVPVPRETAHVRHLMKYAEGVVPGERRFFFRDPAGEVVAVADSLSSFRHAVATVDEPVLAHHAARGDFSRWVLGVFSDPTLGQQVRKTEARWRRGEVPDLRAALERLVGLRYGP